MYKIIGSGGTDATEVNEGRKCSGMELGEYGRVGFVKRYVHHLCFDLLWAKCAMPFSKLIGYERGVMKRNEGRNERSGMKDTSCLNEGLEVQAVCSNCEAIAKHPKGNAGVPIP